MSQVLYKQEMKRLLTEVLLRFGTEHEMGMLPNVMPDDKGILQLTYTKPKTVYCTQTDEGKLLEEIFNFLNKRAVMHTTPTNNEI